MSSALPGIIVMFLGFFLGLCILTVVEKYILERFEIADSPKSLIYPLLSNVLGGILVFLGFLFLVFFGFVGLFIAMDKGYDSAEWMLALGTLAPIIGPLGIILIRSALIRIMNLGGWGFTAAYGLGSSLIVLIVSSFLIGFSLLITSTLGII